MNDQELLRVLEFIERIRAPFSEVAQIDDAASWRIISHLIDCDLRSAPVTISKLALVSGLGHGTAMRRITQMIDDGLIQREPINEKATRFHLHPSEELMTAAVAYAQSAKRLVAQTLGSRRTDESETSYYFGSAHGGATVPPINVLQSRIDQGVELQFLLNDDNYFAAMRNMWSDLRSNLASTSAFHLVSQNELYREGLRNGERAVSKYDLMAIDMPWLGEFASKGLILPIGDTMRQAEINPLDFHPSIWSTTTWRGEEYGVPIYCTIEVMACRSDQFEKAGLAYPRTFDEVITAARRFHDPDRGRYGVSWNAKRGLPVASSFMFFIGCCGATVLSIRKTPTGFSTEHLDSKHMQPLLESDAAFEALAYMHRLLEVTNPNALDMDWDDTCEEFLRGDSAMCYVWTMRAAQFETQVRSAVRNRVAYLPQPARPGGKNTSPIGGFLLCIPSNIAPERKKLAVEALTWMSSREAMKAHMQSGFPVAPRFSMSMEADGRGHSKLVNVVRNLANRNLLRNWQRPPVPFYTRMERILGEEIHDALLGLKSDREALSTAQKRLEAVIRENQTTAPATQARPCIK